MTTSLYAFEPSWDARSHVWRVSVYGFADEPVELRGEWRFALAHPLQLQACGAVDAGPGVHNDRHGLYWVTKQGAQRAEKAARRIGAT